MAQSKKRDKNSVDLPQVPKAEKTDGIDVEFSEELADHDDLVAQERARAADERVKAKKHK